MEEEQPKKRYRLDPLPGRKPPPNSTPYTPMNLFNIKDAKDWKGNDYDGVKFSNTKNGNFKINAKRAFYALHYYIEPKMLFDTRILEQFVHATKQTIRHSKVSEAYIAYLRNDVGLQFDAFNGNIHQDMAKLEMHHGPLFTITDYIKIILNWQLDNGVLTNTFVVAHQVMAEHAMNNVQVAMLTKNNHALVHNGRLKLDMRQCWGDIKTFLMKYQKQINGSPFLLGKIHKYKDQLIDPGFHDAGIITPDTMINWSKPEEEYRPWL